MSHFLSRNHFEKSGTTPSSLFHGEMHWGSPFDASRWLADNPANLTRDNAETIRASGLAIFLEVGDQDHINHDGAEFLHRIMWDHDIRHEYHLIRWDDHVWTSLKNRFITAHRFLAAALSGGLAEPVDLELTEAETEFLNWQGSGGIGDPPEAHKRFNPFSGRALSIHAAGWKLLRDTALDDPETKRAYAKLPPTS